MPGAEPRTAVSTFRFGRGLLVLAVFLTGVSGCSEKYPPEVNEYLEVAWKNRKLPFVADDLVTPKGDEITSFEALKQEEYRELEVLEARLDSPEFQKLAKVFGGKSEIKEGESFKDSVRRKYATKLDNLKRKIDKAKVILTRDDVVKKALELVEGRDLLLEKEDINKACETQLEGHSVRWPFESNSTDFETKDSDTPGVYYTFSKLAKKQEVKFFVTFESRRQKQGLVSMKQGLVDAVVGTMTQAGTLINKEYSFREGDRIDRIDMSVFITIRVSEFKDRDPEFEPPEMLEMMFKYLKDYYSANHVTPEHKEFTNLLPISDGTCNPVNTPAAVERKGRPYASTEANWAADCWRQIRTSLEGPLYYDYHYRTQGAGEPGSEVAIWAEGDIDGDGKKAVWWVKASIDKNGEFVGSNKAIKSTEVGGPASEAVK